MDAHRRSRHGRRHSANGTSLLALLTWLVALGLFALPFLREPDQASPESDDWGRLVSDTDIAFTEDLAGFEADYEVEIADELAAASEEYFGLDSPYLAGTGLIDPARVRSGRPEYETHCAGCHGASGNGAGPAARYLKPRPRNFRGGVFKFTSTGNGQRPLPKDLHQTVTRGLYGSSMPNFRLLSEEKRWDIVEYVRYLSIRGEFEQLFLGLCWDEEEVQDFDEVAELIVERWSPEELQISYPGSSEPPADEASIAAGRELYFEASIANCASCHGPGGKGDGPSATAQNDDWGYPIAPRDLTTGVYRAGSEPADLYRSIATGINGTPMPSFEGSLEPEQIWQLVHFVQSLAR